MQTINASLNDYHISSHKLFLQIEIIHNYLSKESYWCKNIPLSTVEMAIENSFCIGIYYRNVQVGFSRIITDYATFGYLADVFIVDTHRGLGLSKWMMECIVQLSWVKGLRRFSLATLDAHGLYTQFGFAPPEFPDRLLEIVRKGLYNLPAGQP